MRALLLIRLQEGQGGGGGLSSGLYGNSSTQLSPPSPVGSGGGGIMLENLANGPHLCLKGLQISNWGKNI